MSVKPSHAAMRVLSVLDLVAEHQPVRVSALTKLLGEDRSAVQRAVATLAEAGWIRPMLGSTSLWELSAHIFTIAALPQSINILRQRSRQVLENLERETGETAFVAIPDGSRFVIIESVESTHSLRTALRVGQFIDPKQTATGRAFLPYLPPDVQGTMLQRPPTDDEIAGFKVTKERGYSVSVGEISLGATNLAAPLFGPSNEPIAVLVISGPSERLSQERHQIIGSLLLANARSLSQSHSHAAYRKR